MNRRELLTGLAAAPAVNAAGYIDAIMQNLNWDEANRRFEEARKMFSSLRA